MKKVFPKKGFGMIEIIIVASVVAVVISAMMYTASSYLKFSMKTTADIKAGYLLEEGVEAVKLMRDNSWTSNIANVPLNTDRYLVFYANNWSATSSVSTIDGIYVRKIRFSDAYRNGSDELASSGTSDPNTRLLTVSISWMDKFSNATTTKTLSAYIVNLFDN